MTNWNSLSVQLPISNNSKNYLIWLQEAILNIPRGITRLMDMLMDRELQVIRNEALLLLTHLTREAGDIQKIVIFEGAFEKILSIIRGEGNSDGGVVVQRGSAFSFTQQKQIVDIGKTLPLFMELQTLGDRM
ncbi:golgin candidate 6 isoform X1 [Arachis hypogaea]|uniref:golgin candidate 6 isoform X1 n=1 Tax=Arachis hypogaea TaxID=3818 RepID=UPI000DEC8BD8|nr:golgin candidate 6 isoform X1 [Arachis hypogaea]